MNGSGINLGLIPILGTLYVLYCLGRLWIERKETKHIWLLPIAASGVCVMVASLFFELKIGSSSSENRQSILVSTYILTFLSYFSFSIFRNVNFIHLIDYGRILTSRSVFIIKSSTVWIILFIIAALLSYAGPYASNSKDTCGYKCRFEIGLLGDLDYADPFLFFFGAAGSCVILAGAIVIDCQIRILKNKF